MNRALLRLLRLRFRGRLRQMLRGAKTVRGAAFFAVGIGVFLLWLGPSVFMLARTDERTDPETVRAVVPLILLGICLLQVVQGIRQKGIYFAPAEVDFLFGGPFSRRELLAYKISGGMAGAVFIALALSIVLARHASLWIAALVGLFLTLLFVQLFSTAVLLIGQTVAKRAYTRVRRVLLSIVLIAVALGIAPAIADVAESGFMSLARELQQSTVWFVLLFPLQVFGQTLAAERLIPDLVGWGALGMAVDATLLLFVMRLDVNYMEASAAVSAKLYQRVQQARQGRGMLVVRKDAGVHLPPCPWLGGVGPIVWRQATAAIRSARGLLMFLGLITVIVGAPLLLMGTSPRVQLGEVAFPIVFVTIMLSRMLPFDFRGDLDYMDWLKSLPLTPTAIAVGQLLTPTLIMTTVHLGLLGVAAAFVQESPAVLLAGAVFTLPFNLLLFGLENLFFLLFPVRAVAATPGDMRYFGRTAVELFAKILLLVACCGLAAGAGGLAYLAGGGSWIGFVSVSWLVLVFIAAMVVPCVAWAYGRFDVSVDTPCLT